HTRVSRDWSSDVCSSDLGPVRGLAVRRRRPGPHLPGPAAPRRPGHRRRTHRRGGPPVTAPAIQVHGVTVRYGDVLALDDVTLEVGHGVVCGLLGANGSGKSTLFKTIAELVIPQRGSVRIHGLPPERARRRGLLGYVPQSEQVDWAFPVRVVDVVMMGRYGHMGPTRRPRRADHEAVAEA